MWGVVVYSFPDSRTTRPLYLDLLRAAKKIEDELDVMGCVITRDVRWLYHFNLATKQESMHQKSPQSPLKKKVHQAKLMNKIMPFFLKIVYCKVVSPTALRPIKGDTTV